MTRVGLGYDVHQLVTGRRFVLGGVEIEHDRGPSGHSDADVLTHAVIDALLGAAALGDIGRHFPDTDPRYEGADSLGLLAHAMGLLAERGLKVGNVDATVVLEAPKLAPHIPAIREQLAAALAVELDRVSVKATTGERMGFVGRGEGVAAMAVAALEAL